MLHKFPTLPYEFNALEPFIDEKTMRVHYEKHHKTYFKNFISSIKDSGLEKESLEALFANISSHPRGIRNNGGGFYNHTLYWSCMSPDGGGEPSGKLAQSIASTFGSFDEFKKVFSEKAMSIFGSGFTWLSVTSGKLLKVSSTSNQDNPLMRTSEIRGTPVLALDVWEHAYYLRYQNRRLNYIDAWWNIVDWSAISDRYEATIA